MGRVTSVIIHRTFEFGVLCLAAASMFFVTATPALEIQTSADTFTRYELLPVATHSFRIFYDVSAATEGATRYYNPIRRGSDPDVHGVYDCILANRSNGRWWKVTMQNQAGCCQVRNLIRNTFASILHVRFRLPGGAVC